MRLSIDTVAYWIKYNVPVAFSLMQRAAGSYVALRFGGKINRALDRSFLCGTVGGKGALIRHLRDSDGQSLLSFISTIPKDYLKYFSPHGFGGKAVHRVLTSSMFMTYGIIVDGKIIAYALLKVSPSGAAYIGRLVSPQFAGKGLGSFLGRFLYWQAYLSGLRPRSTINRDNIASLKSHQRNKNYRIIGQLPNNYLLIEFPFQPEDAVEPVFRC